MCQFYNGPPFSKKVTTMFQRILPIPYHTRSWLLRNALALHKHWLLKKRNSNICLKALLLYAWLVPRAGKMNQDVCCKYYPSGLDGDILPALDCPLYPARKWYPVVHIINSILTRLVWSRRFDIVNSFLRVYMSIKTQKRPWPISFDLARLSKNTDFLRLQSRNIVICSDKAPL